MDEAKSFWHTLGDWFKPILVTGLSATATAAIVTGLTARDNRLSIDHIRGDTGRLEKRIEDGFSGCIQRYTAMQQSLYALDSRVTVNEQHVSGHANEAKIWIDAIRQLQADVRGLQTDTGKRPDPFTGTEGREFDKRIRALERYMDLDDDRMKKLLERLK